jgi:hypothetical protein
MDDAQLTEQQSRERLEQQARRLDLLGARVKVLEAENLSLATKLRDLGVDLRLESRTALEMPPPVTAELEFAGSAMRSMAAPERRLAEELFAAEPVYVLERSDARVDVGHWLSRGVVWVAATAGDLVLFAAGRRPHVERVPFTVLYQSVYNQVVGELVLGPAPEIKLRQLKLAPPVAYQFLAQIYQQKENEDPKV